MRFHKLWEMDSLWRGSVWCKLEKDKSNQGQWSSAIFTCVATHRAWFVNNAIFCASLWINSLFLLDLVNTIAGGVDRAQLLQVVSGVAQTSEGLEHPLHSRVGPLRGQLLRVCAACQHTQMQRSKNLDVIVKSGTLQRHFVHQIHFRVRNLRTKS